MAKWKDCGYLTYTKKGDRILIVLKHERYVCDLAEVEQVLAKERDYTEIFEPPKVEEEKSSNDEHSETQPSADRNTTPLQPT